MTSSPLPRRKLDFRTMLSIARHHGIKLQTVSTRMTATGTPGQNSSAERGATSLTRDSLSASTNKHPVEIPVENPGRPSVSLKKHLKGIIYKIVRFPGRIRHLKQVLRPQPTEEEKAQLEYLAEQKRFDRLCLREGRIYANWISRKLAQLGEREMMLVPGNQGVKRKMKRCRFDMVTRDERFNFLVLRLNTDPKYLPAHVEVAKLSRPDSHVADELLPTLKRYVQITSDASGVKFKIYRRGIDGLPSEVPAEPFWRKYDPKAMPLLAIPAGYAENSIRRQIDMMECENLIVCGGAGWGKSVFVNNIICYLLWRGLKPADVQFVLFDLKHNLEFGYYEGLPHLLKTDAIKTGIIGDLSEVLSALEELIRIRNQRMTVLKRTKSKNIQTYNSKVKPDQRMPYLMIVIDEWAAIRLTRNIGGLKFNIAAVTALVKEYISKIVDRDELISAEELGTLLMNFAKEVAKLKQATNFGEDAENKLVHLASQGRAVGMHIVLSTQIPSKDVLTGLIKVNFHSVVCFHSNIGGSMAALGTQSAHGLPEKGRAVMLYKGEETIIQTPFVPEGLIESIVDYAITGKRREHSGIDIEQIFQYAIEFMDGVLDRDKLFSIFKEKKVTNSWLSKSLADAEGHTFIINEQEYKVLPRGQRKPRRLQLIQPHIEPAP
jgi:hypothetical protein